MNPDAVANKMTAALLFAVALILPQSTMAKDAVQSREYPQAAFAGVSVHIPAGNSYDYICVTFATATWSLLGSILLLRELSRVSSWN